MHRLSRFFLWFGLLSKRLLRRPAYLAVLLLVPLFALALSLFSRQESGVVRVALVREDSADPAAAAAVERLTAPGSVLLCREVEDEAAAREAVRRGTADAAWIFAADCGYQLERFAHRGHGAAVRVIEREDNVFLMLSREKLFAALYSEASFAIFADYLRSDLGAAVDNAEARRYYERMTMRDEIVRFETVEGASVSTDAGYLTAPLRGMMALLLVLCGMASGLYCCREEREEVFAWLPARARWWLPVLSHMTAILPAALAALGAMALAGVTVGALREAAVLLLYVPAAALFCELLRCLCPREEQYGALIPLLSVAMLAFCPIFLDLNLLPPLPLLLPPTWALRAVWDGAALWGLAGYTLLLFALTAAVKRLGRR